MNRMFLKSTLPLSQTVVKAVKNGLSKDNLFMLSHQTMRRKHGTSMSAEAECALIGAAKKAKLSEKEIVSIIMTEGISLGQINYALLKDKQQIAASPSKQKITSQKKNNKSKVPRKVSPMQQKLNERVAFIKKETVIVGNLKKAFSSPLKITTSTVFSPC